MVASTESPKNGHTLQGRHTKANLKENHPQNLPEVPIHDVVSVLLVLTELCNVNLQIFFQDIKNIIIIFENPKLDTN